MERLTKEVWEKLSAPFPEEEIEWKVAKVFKGRGIALVVPYISARSVMDRLDEVVGPDGWSFDFELLPDGTVKGKLTVLGVTKCDRGDIGGEDSTGTKGSTSDALKRCGVLFGIGRYLYRAPRQYLKYDEKAEKLLEKPKLPQELLPKRSQESPPENPKEPPTEEVRNDVAVSLEALLEQIDHLQNPLEAKEWGRQVAEQVHRLPQDAQEAIRDAYQVKMKEFAEALKKEVEELWDVEAAKEWEEDNTPRIEALPKNLQKEVWEAFSERVAELEEVEEVLGG